MILKQFLNCHLLVTMLLIGFSSVVTPYTSYAGQLEDFENAATQDNNDKDNQVIETRHKRHGHKHNSDFSHDSDNCDLDSFISCMVSDMLNDIFEGIITYPAQLSLERMRGDRKVGEPDLPYLAMELNFQRVDSNIVAIDGRAEVGYGPIGFELRGTHFRESNPDDTLNLVYTHGLYRMSGSRNLQVNVGVGSIILNGRNSNSGLSFTAPISLYPKQNYGFRFYPTWSWINGNEINDYDGSVEFVRKFYSLRLGYRRTSTNDRVLGGPYVGFTVFY